MSDIMATSSSITSQLCAVRRPGSSYSYRRLPIPMALRATIWSASCGGAKGQQTFPFGTCTYKVVPPR